VKPGGAASPCGAYISANEIPDEVHHRRFLLAAVASVRTIASMLTDCKRERRIRKVLKRLSRQRVAMVLEPGRVPVIEMAVLSSEEIEADLWTCRLRGWLEVVEVNAWHR
jgi:hypothetical protein